MASTEKPSERIDGCTQERKQTVSQSNQPPHSKFDQAPFIAFGVEVRRIMPFCQVLA